MDGREPSGKVIPVGLPRQERHRPLSPLPRMEEQGMEIKPWVDPIEQPSR